MKPTREIEPEGSAPFTLRHAILTAIGAIVGWIVVIAGIGALCAWLSR